MSLLVSTNPQNLKCFIFAVDIFVVVVVLNYCPSSDVLGLNEVDYSHYPERAFQLQWLRSYLEAYKEHKGQDGEVTDTEVEILYVQVNKFALVS